MSSELAGTRQLSRVEKCIVLEYSLQFEFEREFEFKLLKNLEPVGIEPTMAVFASQNATYCAKPPMINFLHVFLII